MSFDGMVPRVAAPALPSVAISHSYASNSAGVAAPPTATEGFEVRTRPKFPRDDRAFHTELCRRVSEFFKQTGRRERDCWRMYVKSAMVMAWWAASYILLVFYATTWWEAVPLAISFAFALAAIGFNIQHDGGHSAYSNRRWINKMAAASLDLMGASSYLWHYKHGVLHHTYTNIAGVDTDIELGAAARLAPHQPRYWIHRFQYIYLFPLYGIMAIRWHLWGDFADIMKGRIGAHRTPRPKGWDLALFIGGKVISTALLLVIPLCLHEWWVFGIYYLFTMALLGMILSVVFQLAHCVEEADFPMPEQATMQMESSWAVHQVQTTVNFARGNPFLCWFLGGLNFQIEHHLFPRISHVHYPAISKIVEATCNEYGVKYSSHRTFTSGTWSHIRWLYRMGREEAPVAKNVGPQSVA